MKFVNKKWIYDHLNSYVNTNSNVSFTVKKIIQDIKKNKDLALLKYVKKFENQGINESLLDINYIISEPLNIRKNEFYFLKDLYIEKSKIKVLIF